MPVSVIVGGQYGSEGKGKVAYFFAKKYKAAAVIRVGGPNSGHTVINNDRQPMIFKHLSTAAILKDVKCVLTSGHYINLEILFEEIKLANIDRRNLIIDPHAMIITDEHQKQEAYSGLVDKIGSTGCGLGAAIIDRISRNKNVLFAKDVPELSDFILDTNEYLRGLLSEGKRIIIEGTQGFGLSLLHSDVYPYCTSRDTSAAGFVSEAGLSPLDVDDIILVLRAFPIRVAGNSGPLKNETNWDKVSIESGSKSGFYELTSVSKKIRRVGEFDSEIVAKAIRYNRPTQIVLNHVDYFDKTASDVSKKMLKKIDEIEKSIGCNINFIGINRHDLIPLHPLGNLSENIKSIHYA